MVGNALGEQRAYRGGARAQLVLGRRVGVEEALCEAHRADVEAVVPADSIGTSGDELRRAAAEIHDHRSRVKRAVRGDAAKRQQRLVVP